MTFEKPSDDVEVPETTTGWIDLLGALVDLQGQQVTVRITERAERIAELRGHLHRSTGFSAEQDALLLWIGRTMPSVAFAVSREFLHSWSWTEDDGIAELRIQHGTTTIVVDFSPGAGAP
ncbi:MAG TPA: hypothetical protein VG188_01010 [Solirubrobacteraceae bacterium]|jgi:hypothetical protein|nr:hypothetical protein [Solirubrobacteraceae bacterium]